MRIPVLPAGGNLAELLERRAAQQPDGTAYVWLKDDLSTAGCLTYAGLLHDARCIAGSLLAGMRPGDRALLAYGAGLDAIRAFWACLYAGIVPVPAPSPEALRLKSALPRLRAIARDAATSVVLTTASLRDAARALSLDGEAGSGNWIATDIEPAGAHWREMPRSSASHHDVAYLQYTSGSTSVPRGVEVTHRNVMENCASLQECNGSDSSSRALFWLPYFHDYGLVHAILWPVHAGVPAYLMSPVTFLRRPLRWLDAVARFGITITGAPNFAYSACVEALQREPSWHADLRRLQSANCGAEPIDPRVVGGFARAFAAHGFMAEAFAPGYGLAEATLMVTTKRHGTLPTLLEVDRNELAQSRVRPATGDTRTLVGCGLPARGTHVAIVDPQSLDELPADRVGEIWVAGGSVCRGYHGVGDSKEFGQTLAGHAGRRWLRTGDLGFIHRGELFVTGRLKDLIIHRGRNHFPQDIERSVQLLEPRLRKGGGAAFAEDSQQGDALVIVHEVERQIADGELPAIAAAMRRIVADEHELPVHTIALVQAGSIPRTSSGKIQRRLCRTRLREGILQVRFIEAQRVDTPRDWLPPTLDRERFAALPGRQARMEALRAYIAERVGTLTGRGVADVTLQSSAVECGLDSLAAFQLQNEIEGLLGAALSPAIALSAPSLAALADAALDTVSGAAADDGARELRSSGSVEAGGDATTLALSAPQEGVWFVENLVGRSALYHLPQAARFHGPLDRARLANAFRMLVARHAVLRTAFQEQDGRPRQVVQDHVQLELQETDLRGLPASQQPGALRRWLDAGMSSPFDLAVAPLMRVQLARVADQEHVLLVVTHHLVSDGWSMAVLARELNALYGAGGEPGALSPLATDYSGYVHWQRRRLKEGAIRRHVEYWNSKLAGMQALNVPTDRPRPAQRTWRGAVERFEIPAELAGRLRSLAREENSTLFMVLLAAFQALLMRYTGQEDVSVGSPTAGRLREEFQPLLGFFTNTLVLRTDLGGNPAFRELVRRVRTVTLEAYEHQELPSDRLVSQLGLPRELGRNALYPAAFALQNMPDTALRLEGLRAAAIPAHTGTAKSDLWMSVVSAGDALHGELEYSTDLFDAGTMQAMCLHYLTLLAGAVAAPETPLMQLPLLTPAERHRILVEWNATERMYPPGACAHRFFEQHAAATPEATAVVLDGQELSYGELDRRANRLAQHLRSLGAGPDVNVAICMQRSPELVVALLAAAKSGAAFVPVDPEYPRERIEYMLADSQAAVLLTQEALRERLCGSGRAAMLCLDSQSATWHDHESSAPEVAFSADQAAYVIYTSGSSGRPKGVVVTHGALCNHVHWIVEALALTCADRVLQKTSISFDASLWEFFAPLMVGGPVVLAPPDAHRDNQRLLEVMRGQRITVMLLVPSALRTLLDEPQLAQASSLRYLICGGEALDRDLARDFRRCLPGVTLGNFYGPTEAADDATSCVVEDVPPGPGTIPIGRPIANARCHVLDQHLQPVPAGVIGELYIGGAGLARGYLDRPELTAERFIADPFVAGERLYRTGDLARYLRDGALEYIGRADSQVKVRGFRIELGEIEVALQSCPNVRQAAVLADEESGADRRLVAYVCGTALEPRDLRDRLRAMLPDHMVPGTIVPLQQLPLLPNGKLDRKALPVPAADPGTQDLVEPRNPLEETLRDIWRDVLREPRIGVHQGFFELGGHSLLATQVMSRTRQALQVDLPLRALFEEPTIAGMARLIRSRQSASVPALEAPIEVLVRDRPLPVSFSQRRMWFVQQFEPDGTAYNMPFALRLTGRLDHAALQQAVTALVARHEAFRTTFAIHGGEPVQVISPHQQSQIRRIDLRSLPAPRREAQTRRLFREEAMRPFDLAAGPLFRFTLVQLGEEDHAVLWLIHHAIGDQWSAGIISRDLAALYHAFTQHKTVQLPPLAVQYADYAAWQRRQLGGAALDHQVAYWKRQLRGLQPLALPTDHPRPAHQSFHGSYFSAAIPQETLSALKRLGARHGATPFMVLLTAFKLLLARYSGQDDIAIGVPIANRTHVATEDLMGTLVNTLVMRSDLSGNPTFAQALTRVRATALDSYAHQDLPFERLVEELGATRNGGVAPLVQVLFNVPNAPVRQLGLDGLDYELFEFDHGSAQFDLAMSVETELFGRIHLTYCTDLFTPATAQRMLGHYVSLIEQVVAAPDEPIAAYQLLSATERRGQLVDWNDTRADFPLHQRADQLIAAQAAKTPDEPAVTMGGRSRSYRELEADANRLARHLRQHGVRRGSAVGICLERSPEMITALLAVMKSGGCYVPLDPVFPRDRLQYMAEDAGLGALITHSELLQTLPHMPGSKLCIDEAAPAIRALPDGPLESASGPDDLAYVLYTSGSTGKPKGVEITHRALTNFLCSMRRQPGCGATDRMLSVTTLSFDIAGLELFLPLVSGAQVGLASRHEAGDGRLLRARMREFRPTLMQATPATWRMLIGTGWQGSRRLRVLCGGETLSPDLATQLLERCAELWNMYGPTETTIWSTLARVAPPLAGHVPIGRPIANTTVYVLDRALQPVPTGLSGELFIGGAGVARGYRNLDALTAERFIADPFEPGGRLYRTGDLARYTADGQLLHLGRLDSQVKIRGYRIELGEVENCLSRHPVVAQAVVTARPGRDGTNQLVAYVKVRAGQTAPDPLELGTFVRSTLPDYMVPSQYVFLDAFPLTANNKVDVRSLPAPSSPAARPSPMAIPRGRLEVQLTALWRSVLENDAIGVHDNFFDAGGHSLGAVQLVSCIEQVCGQALPLATLLQAPTVAQMARLLQKRHWKPAWDSLVAIQPIGDRLPLFAIPGVGGNVLMFAGLSRMLGPQRPFYGLQARGLDKAQKPFTSVPKMASHYIREIRSVRPHGPYLIAGTCTGGVIAYEMARQLLEAGEKVTLMLLETWHPSTAQGPMFTGMLIWPLLALWSRYSGRSDDSSVASATWHAVSRYRPRPLDTRLLNVIATARAVHPRTVDTRRLWETLASGGAETHCIPAIDSGQLFVPAHVGALAAAIEGYIRREHP